MTVWSPGSPSLENRSGLGSQTPSEAGGKETGVGQPAEGSRQLLTGCHASHAAVAAGMLPVTNGSETWK